MNNTLVSRVLTTSRSAFAALPLRAALGAVMIGHGAQKLFGWWGGYGLHGTAGFFESIGLKPGLLHASLAGGTEFLGGLLVLIGLATRPAATALIGVMTVAIITVHHGAFFAENHGMEYPLTLLLAALGLVFLGGGPASIDARLSRARA